MKWTVFIFLKLVLFCSTHSTDLNSQRRVNKHANAPQLQFEYVLERVGNLEGQIQRQDRELKQQERDLQMERKKWREEREQLQASLRHLQKENLKLLKLFEQEKGPIKPDHTDDTGSTPSQQSYSSNLQTEAAKSFKNPQQLVARADDIDALEPVVNQISQRVSAMEADMEALKNANALQDAHIQQAATSTFVRWGRSTCPASSELVYAGSPGGADYRGYGSSTSVLCLPLNPVFGNLTKSPFYAELWGSEYQTHTTSPLHEDKDPVCAVCRTPRPSSIMMPATNVCEDGWVLEYSGYLMGSLPSLHGGHDFVCMDSALEDRVGSELSQEGVLMYFTFAKCGTSLPCPPYQDDKLITCAVCSK